MDDLMGFIEVAGAIIVAMGLAMSLEWVALNALLRVMPQRHQGRRQ
jgi:mannose/fructose/N-acetylgalactosamine-specific phosphotransferase system component IIC